jgi:hypothetical protein
MLQSIATNPKHSYYYARDVLNGENVPTIMLQRIATDSYHSYYYAIEVLKGKNVPTIMLQRIATDSYYSYHYASDVLQTPEKIKDFIHQYNIKFKWTTA